MYPGSTYTVNHTLFSFVWNNESYFLIFHRQIAIEWVIGSLTLFVELQLRNHITSILPPTRQGCFFAGGTFSWHFFIWGSVPKDNVSPGQKTLSSSQKVIHKSRSAHVKPIFRYEWAAAISLAFSCWPFCTKKPGEASRSKQEASRSRW